MLGSARLLLASLVQLGLAAGCFECDLSSVSVPAEIAWAAPGTPGYVRETQANLSVATYWEEITKKTAEGKSLSDVCQMPGSVIDYMVKADPKGMLIALRGDTSMRSTFVALAKSMISNHSVFGGGKKDKDVRPHRGWRPRRKLRKSFLFCCQGLVGSEFTQCQLKKYRRDPLMHRRRWKKMREIRKRLEAGQTCLLYSHRIHLWQDGRWLRNMGKGKYSLSPRVTVVNTPARFRSLHGFGRQVNRAMKAYKKYVNSSNTTKLIVLSSTPAPKWPKWSEQKEAFEVVRKAVNSTLAEKPKGVLSLFDVQSLAGVDSCGAPQTFPARKYWMYPTCSSNYTAATQILGGGFYLHLAKLIGFTLASNEGNCLPPPYNDQTVEDSAAIVEIKDFYMNVSQAKRKGPKEAEAKSKGEALLEDVSQAEGMDEAVDQLCEEHAEEEPHENEQ